ncbi:MAG: hypothetical protein IGS39_02705 [Calothrix sp. C42_A2020_038]|nr:hypothetical protein [Calothrix sp. C42_A2020_038]
MKKKPPIYFYIPKVDFPDWEIPEDADQGWRIFESKPNNAVYNWSLQTYIRLKAQGYECQLIDTLPASGIILAHRYSLPFHLRPKPSQLIVCMKADHDFHPYAQLHIVQNKQEANRSGGYYFIPHWRQPGLVPRDSTRGSKFENIGYYGIEKNIAPEFKDPKWSEQLKALGLHWHIVGENAWNDYSKMDAVIAVRSFQVQDYRHKPASKLYNAWHARVPAIVGGDSAFRAERRSELDYIEVASPEETITAIKRLRDDTNLFHAMVENGAVRAEAFTVDKVCSQWRNFLTEVAIPAYYRWCESGLNQKLYFAKRYLTVLENNLKPQSIYPHDQEVTSKDNISISDLMIILTMQKYRSFRGLMT